MSACPRLSHLSSDGLSSPAEHDLDVLTEPGRVPVPDGGRVSEGLQERVRLEDDLFDVLEPGHKLRGPGPTWTFLPPPEILEM